jgi:thioredoxin reductase
MFDVLIIGGGVSGISCSFYFGVLYGFCQRKKSEYLHIKKRLQEAIFNNAYGIAPGSLGSDLLKQSTQNLSNTYNAHHTNSNEKYLKVEGEFPEFTIVTNKNSYKSKIIVIGIGQQIRFPLKD